LKELKEVLRKCKSSYVELISTGEIESEAVGEKVRVNMKANVCGDILIFIRPKEEIKLSFSELMKLISTDNQIEVQKEFALKMLAQKHEALLVLPRLISYVINLLLITVSLIFTSKSILIIIGGSFEPEFIINLWPWIFPILTIIFRKSIGFKIISFFT
jgi:hypothetical protein